MQKLSTLQFFLHFFGLSHSTGDGEVGKWLKIALARVKFAAQSFGNYVRTLTPDGRVSVRGVKSLSGNRVAFPRFGTGDTERWQINLSLCATC